MKMKSKINDSTREDRVAEYIINELNKGEKVKLSYNLEEDDSPSNVKHWISSGCSVLDVILSNKKDGGFPCGRYILISGKESSGKSLVAAHALASVQKAGGLAAFIDSENAVSKEFLKAIGVDLNNLIYVQTQDITVVFKAIRKIINSVIEKGYKKPVLIVVDSMTAPTLPEYLDVGEGMQGYEGAKKASYISTQLPKLNTELGADNICLIYTAQLRQNLSAMGNEDRYNVTGGMALKFYASQHIRLKRKGLDRVKGEDPIGVVVEAETLKNRLAPERRKTCFFVRYDRGIDDDRSVLREAIDYGIVKGTTWKTYTASDGREIKAQGIDLKKFKDEGVFEEIRDKLLDLKIKKYRNDDIITEETELDIVSDNE